MTKISDEQLLRLWRASYPLWQAWLTFSKAQDRQRWKALMETSAMDALSEGAKAVSEIDADFSTKITQVFAGTQKILRERTAHQTKLQQGILKFIKDGHLHGFGFEPPRTLNAVPVAIPKSAWSGHIDWENNTLTFESIKLVEVRLTTNRIRNEILERGNVDKTPVQPQGRPTVRHAIEAAFYALNEAGKVDPTASQMSHYPLIREWLELNHPDLKVPPAYINPETIRLHFSPFFNALKKPNKQ
ncbi:hypothetical protein KUD11_03760 [Roseovarius sp. LXJ103]|uniref:hypothetical protein n=1 Tax=Roseovarius carneus TaxID=2853164 RepID=UPI000D6063A1|nr:hypothetical protein [Roseovarius carneus]MBZ8117760.1 hypothetical protein [Roseovarius carneus]PWE36468.1 hypothetical protein DD563_11195 [Pelagicola sp. LXJ1103]